MQIENSGVGRILRQLRWVLYPRRCPFCDRVLGSVSACPDCKEELETLRRRPTFRLARERHYIKNLEGAAAPYRYAGCVRRGVLRAKFQAAPWAADELGVELEVVDMSFDGIIPAVKSGQVDLGIAAFTKTPERAEEIDFSDLYEKSAQLLIVKAGNADLYSTKESLAGQKVGAQKGTIQSQLIQTALPDSELFELEKYPALALEVQNGNIAGLVVDQAVGESLIATSNGGLEVSNFAFTSEEASFGKAVVAAKGSEDLLAEVNIVIDQVVNDGSYLKAYDEAVELAASMGL